MTGNNAANPMAYYSTEVGFFRADLAELVDAYLRWVEPIYTPLGWHIEQTAVEGHIDDLAGRLAPTAPPPITKDLFVTCGNGWVCYLNNAPRGTDCSGKVSVLSDRLRCETVRLVIATRIPESGCPSFLTGPIGFKAVILSHHSASDEADLDLYSANDGGRWVHGSFGPLRDAIGVDTTVSRAHPFTLDRLLGVCALFGLHPVDSSWYGRKGVFLQKHRVQ